MLEEKLGSNGLGSKGGETRGKIRNLPDLMGQWGTQNLTDRGT